MSRPTTRLKDYYSTRYEKDAQENKWQGHEITTAKQPDNTRIMFHNINGLTGHGTAGFDTFIQEQVTLDIDVQAFSEHCLDTSQFQVTNTMAEVLRQQHVGQSLLQLNSSPEKALNRYRLALAQLG